jgi:hypothetical protein
LIFITIRLVRRDTNPVQVPHAPVNTKALTVTVGPNTAHASHSSKPNIDSISPDDIEAPTPAVDPPQSNPFGDSCFLAAAKRRRVQSSSSKPSTSGIRTSAASAAASAVPSNTQADVTATGSVRPIPKRKFADVLAAVIHGNENSAVPAAVGNASISVPASNRLIPAAFGVTQDAMEEVRTPAQDVSLKARHAQGSIGNCLGSSVLGLQARGEDSVILCVEPGQMPPPPVVKVEARQESWADKCFENLKRARSKHASKGKQVKTEPVPMEADELVPVPPADNEHEVEPVGVSSVEAVSTVCKGSLSVGEWKDAWGGATVGKLNAFTPAITGLISVSLDESANGKQLAVPGTRQEWIDNLQKGIMLKREEKYSSSMVLDDKKSSRSKRHSGVLINVCEETTLGQHGTKPILKAVRGGLLERYVHALETWRSQAKGDALKLYKKAVVRKMKAQSDTGDVEGTEDGHSIMQALPDGSPTDGVLVVKNEQKVPKRRRSSVKVPPPTPLWSRVTREWAFNTFCGQAAVLCDERGARRASLASNTAAWEFACEDMYGSDGSVIISGWTRPFTSPLGGGEDGAARGGRARACLSVKEERDSYGALVT